MTLCGYPGCERPKKCRGFCSTHYSRWYRGGDMDGAVSEERYSGMRAANDRRHAERRAEIESGEWLCARCGVVRGAEEFSLTYNPRAHASSRRRTCKLCEAVRKYGLDARTWQELLDSQGGVCAVCEEESDRWCVDHDHRCCPGIGSCGECVRAILCNNCNAAEGFLRNPETARRMADYMEVGSAVGGVSPA